MYDSLGNRMKRYENVYRIKLTPKVPVIVRLDGKAFHTLTRKYCKNIFDEHFYDSMFHGVKMVIDNISQGFKVAYFQSDEVSILLTDYDNFESQPFFDYNIQKLVSVMASAMSVGFSYEFGNTGLFDGRAFNVPKEDIYNYFLWRCQDCKRNSINSYARMFFSHKELMNKNQNDIHNMLYSIGKNWATDVPNKFKNGTFVYKSDGLKYPYEQKVSYDGVMANYGEIKSLFKYLNLNI